MRVCKLHNQIKVVWWFSGKFSRLENFREVSFSNEIGKSSQVFLVKRDCVQKPCRWVRPQPRIFLIRIETTSLSNIFTGKKGLRNVHPYGHIFRYFKESSKLPFWVNLFLRFLSGASRKITLSAGICCVGEGGKNATGVNPVGTNPAAIA